MPDDNINAGSAATQNVLLAIHLDKGNSVTGLDALHDLGIMRLPARIYDLKKQGMKISDEWVKLPNGKRVKQWKKA